MGALRYRPCILTFAWAMVADECELHGQRRPSYVHALRDSIPRFNALTLQLLG